MTFCCPLPRTHLKPCLYSLPVTHIHLFSALIDTIRVMTEPEDETPRKPSANLRGIPVRDMAWTTYLWRGKLHDFLWVSFLQTSWQRYTPFEIESREFDLIKSFTRQKDITGIFIFFWGGGYIFGINFGCFIRGISPTPDVSVNVKDPGCEVNRSLFNC